ncbi:MAG: MFS transporter [Myxococcales bacterium]|nr:MFS transporter [Myxococcales bacterium]MDH3485705.1 MFS transporter [Myxococcales bacterium]
MKWTKRVEDPNVWRIYRATVVLSVAYGMALSLIAIFLDAKGFTKSDIGSLAVAFGLGIVALSLVMDQLIERFSARGMLVASFFGYAATVAVFPFLDSFASLAVIRFFDGGFSVGIWVSAETILLSRAGGGNKAFTMSLYAVAMGVGYMLGPGIAWALTRLGPLSIGFVAAGVISTFAGLYALFTLDPDKSTRQVVSLVQHEDEAPEQARRRLSRGELLWQIKNSCFATFAYGYFQASAVLFLPLYLIQSKGITEGRTIWIPAFFALGMLLFTNPVGLLGDRIGHLLTMRGLATIGMTMVLGFVFLDSYPLMCIAIVVAGATLASISPVSLALQGVSVRPEDYGRGTAIYNTFYALGMLIGPKVTADIFERYGGAMMLYHLAALWGGFVLFSLIFYRDDPAARARSLVSRRSRA